MTRGVTATRRRSDGHTECEQCDRLHPQATRERVRQHVSRTGHTARYIIEDTTVYRPAHQLETP